MTFNRLPLFFFTSSLLAAPAFATGAPTHFVCHFKEDDIEISATFTILDIEQDPKLQGEPVDDDHITANETKNSPMVFQYHFPNSPSESPQNPLYFLAAGAFDESTDLNQITQNGKEVLAFTTADSENCTSLEIDLDRSSHYQTGIYRVVDCGDGVLNPVPVTCVVTPTPPKSKNARRSRKHHPLRQVQKLRKITPRNHS